MADRSLDVTVGVTIVKIKPCGDGRPIPTVTIDSGIDDDHMGRLLVGIARQYKDFRVRLHDESRTEVTFQPLFEMER